MAGGEHLPDRSPVSREAERHDGHLVEAFKQRHPQYQRVFVETLPPGILAKQIETGSLVMGNLRIALKPDIFTNGQSSIADLQKEHDWFADTVDYARNPLAIMVAKGNPKHVQGLKDLGRSDVRVSMPNPKCRAGMPCWRMRPKIRRLIFVRPAPGSGR